MRRFFETKKLAIIAALSLPINGFALWTWDDCTNWCSGWNYNFCGDIALSGGYRCDKITAHVDAFSAPDVFEGTDDLKIDDLSIWEIGAKGRIYFGNFYLRSNGYCGFGNSGHYREHGDNSFGQPSFESRASLHSISTQDFIFGIGYVFTFNDYWNNCLGIAPVGGWGYNQQRVKLSHGETNGIEDQVFDGLVYKNRWNGPWIGFDLQYQICDFAFYAGYEYHWLHWHAEWLLDDVNVLPTAFSDRRRTNNANGYAVYLDGYWNFLCSWEIGLGFKFQEFNVNKSSLKPVAGFEEAGLPPTEDDEVWEARWLSAQVTINLGYYF